MTTEIINIFTDEIAISDYISSFLENLEPNTVYSVKIHYDKDKVDKPIFVNPGSLDIKLSTDRINWSSENIILPVGEDLYLQFTSLPYGEINSKIITISFGYQLFSFDATTKAPEL